MECLLFVFVLNFYLLLSYTNVDKTVCHRESSLTTTNDSIECTSFVQKEPLCFTYVLLNSTKSDGHE